MALSLGSNANTMISPLQTWQHQDPKGLWPVLSGLAFLAHVGVIGMSVPYLLEWQASEKQSSAVTIPIELVAIAPAESTALAPSDTAVPANSQSELPDSQRPAKSQASSARSQVNSVSQPLRPSTVASTDLVGGSLDSSISREQTENLEAQNEVQNIKPSMPEPSSSSKETSETQREPIEREDNSVRESTEASSQGSQPPESFDQSVEPDASLQAETLQTVEGETLPSPSIDTQFGRSLQFKVVGSPQYDPVADFESAPPELIDTGYAEVLQPEEKGCKAVSTQATGIPLIYRIGVNEDGTIYSASLQSSAALDSRDDEAVTCLIVSSGITFNRPSNSASRIDDNLLMTFELSEL